MRMNFSYAARVKLGITCLVVALIAANVRQLVNAIKLPLPPFGADEISLYEKRFEGLRPSLPPRGVVTYVDDCGGEKEVFKAYMVSQYALSPVVLFYAPFSARFYSSEMIHQKREFVIQNSHDPGREPYLVRLLPNQFPSINVRNPIQAPNQKPVIDEHLVLVKDLGNGVQLYRTRN